MIKLLYKKNWSFVMYRDLDETRKKIENAGLSDKEKRDMFNKFEQSGGKVIKDSKHNSTLKNFDRNKQREFVKQNNSVSPQKDPKIYIRKKHKKRKKHRTGSLFTRLRLYVRSVLSKVMDSSGKYLSIVFFDMMKDEAQNKLLDLKLIITPLIHSSSGLKTQLMKSLNSSGHHFYELLLRLDNLYNEREFREILLRYETNKNARITPKSIGESLRDLYKRIYLLRNMPQSCMNAIVKSLRIQEKMDGKSSVATKRNIQHAKKDLNFIFNTLLPKLHIAILNILKRNLFPGHPDLETFLDISKEDKIGYLTEEMQKDIKSEKERKKEFEKTVAKRKEEGKEIYQSELEDDVKEGMQIMRKIHTKRDELAKTTTLMPLAHINEEDKMYLTTIYFNELQKEFSFLLISNKIKFSLDFHAGKKTDIKERLSDLYTSLDKIAELIIEFNRYTKEYQETKNSQFTMNQKSKIMNKLSLNKARYNNKIREGLGNVASNIRVALKTIIDDYNGEKHLLQNPNDKMEFQLDSDQDKKLAGMTIINCFKKFYNFLAALEFRLLNGDLAGYNSDIEQKLFFDEDSPEENKKITEKTTDKTSNGKDIKDYNNSDEQSIEEETVQIPKDIADKISKENSSE